MANLFEERVSMSPLPLALLGGAAFLEFCLAYTLQSGSKVVFWTQIVMGVVFVTLLVLLKHFTVRVGDTVLTFGFGPFRKTVALSQIVTAYADEATLASTGIGIHIVRAGYWAWIARPGTAVRILLVVGSNVPGYIISTERPRDLIAVLTTKQAPLEPPAEGRPGASI